MLEPYYLIPKDKLSRYGLSKNYTSFSGIYIVPVRDVTLTYSDKLVTSLINEFDFESARKVMKLLNWKWHDVGIPTVDEMKDFVFNLYDAIKSRIEANEYCYTASGGFRLVYSPEEDNELTLTFEAVSHSVYGD